MLKLIRSTAIFLIGTLLTTTPVFALTVLKNDEARNYLGDVKAHLLSGAYVYGVLVRSHRDAMHGRFSDGVVFNPEGGRILFLRNKDGDRKLVIDATDGREKDPVTEDAWRQKIQNTLSDDNPNPYIFLDDSKKEIATVFVGRGTEVNGKINGEGFLEISLMVEGTRDRQQNRRLIR